MRASRGALALFALLAVVGIASAAYVLVQQRLTLPGTDTYEVAIELTAADGVAPGLGQPVRVAGVKVGSIADTRLRRGRALVTLELQRDLLPVVYRDARAALVPITPLKDMQVELNPGRVAAGPLGEGATIEVARTSSPASLTELLSALDRDTRDFVTSLIANVDLGTRGRADGVRRALRSLGPATSQVRSITTRLDGRRRSLARLVRNLGTITAAAGENQSLRTVVESGQDVLQAVAREDRALDAGLRRLPGTLTTVRQTLRSTAEFTRELTPTLAAITPATVRLPRTLDTLEPFARETAVALRSEIRPLVREARPLVRRLARASTDLGASAPALTTAMRVANYALNELAYNPPGDDEGLLFWFPWWFHNYNSMFSAQDAHGSSARAMVLVNCQQLTPLAPLGDIFKVLLGTYSLCRGD